MAISQELRDRILKMSPEGQKKAAQAILKKRQQAEAPVAKPAEDRNFFQRGADNLRGAFEGLQSVGESVGDFAYDTARPIGERIKEGFNVRSKEGFSDIPVTKDTGKIKKFGLGLLGAAEGGFKEIGFEEKFKKFDEEVQKESGGTFLGNLKYGTGGVAKDVTRGAAQRAIDTGLTGYDWAKGLVQSKDKTVIDNLRRAQRKEHISKFIWGDDPTEREKSFGSIGREGFTAGAALSLGGIGGLGKLKGTANVLKTSALEGGLEYLGTENKESAIMAAFLAGAGELGGVLPTKASKIAKTVDGTVPLGKKVAKTAKNVVTPKANLFRDSVQSIIKQSDISTAQRASRIAQIAEEFKIPAFQRKSAKLKLEEAIKNFDKNVSGKILGDTQLALPSPKKASADFIAKEFGDILDIRRPTNDITSRLKIGLQKKLDDILPQIKQLEKKGTRKSPTEISDLASFKGQELEIKKLLLDKEGLGRVSSGAGKSLEKISQGGQVSGLEAGKFGKVLELLQGRSDLAGASPTFVKNVSGFLNKSDMGRVDRLLSGQSKLPQEQAVGELNNIINTASQKSKRFNELNSKFSQNRQLSLAEKVEFKKLQDGKGDIELFDKIAENNLNAAKEKAQTIEKIPDNPFYSDPIDNIGAVNAAQERKVISESSGVEPIKMNEKTMPKDAKGGVGKNSLEEASSSNSSSESVQYKQKSGVAIAHNAFRTSEGVFGSYGNNVANGMRDIVGEHNLAHVEVFAPGMRSVEAMKKFPAEIRKSANDKIKNGITDMSPQEAAYAKVSNGLADFTFTHASDAGSTRPDGGAVERLRNFTPEVSVNYATMKKAQKAERAKEVAEFNDISVDEAIKELESEYIDADGNNIFGYGSLAHRRKKSSFKLPPSDIDPIVAWETYLHGVADHVARTKALGMVGENGKYVYKKLDNFLEANVGNRAERTQLRMAMEANLGIKTGIYHEAVRAGKMADADFGQKLVKWIDAGAGASKTGATLFVDPVKTTLYDGANIVNSLFNNGVVNTARGAFDAVIRTTKSKQINKLAKDMGVFEFKNNASMQGVESFSGSESAFKKLIDFRFKLPGLTQSISAKVDMMGANKQLGSFINKKKLSKSDILTMQQEFGMSRNQIENRKVLGMDEHAAAVVYHVQTNINAQRGSKNLLINSGGNVANAVLAYMPMQLMPSAQFMRGLKRDPVRYALGGTGVAFAVGEGIEQLKDEKEGVLGYLNSQFNTAGDRQTKSTAAEKIWEGFNTLRGVDWFIGKAYDKNPALSDKPWYQHFLTKNLLVAMTGSVGINSTQAEAVSSGIAIASEEGFTDKAIKKLTTPLGETRGLYKALTLKDEDILENLSAKQIVSKMQEGTLNSAVITEFAMRDAEEVAKGVKVNDSEVQKKGKDIWKRLIANSAQKFGRNSDEYQNELQIFKRQYPKTKQSTIEKLIFEYEAEEEGKSTSKYLYDLISKNENPLALTAQMHKDGLLTKKDIEYFTEVGGF